MHDKSTIPLQSNDISQCEIFSIVCIIFIIFFAQYSSNVLRVTPQLIEWDYMRLTVSGATIDSISFQFTRLLRLHMHIKRSYTYIFYIEYQNYITCICKNIFLSDYRFFSDLKDTIFQREGGAPKAIWLRNAIYATF